MHESLKPSYKNRPYNLFQTFFSGMTCFRDVNKPCCEPAVCQYKAALEKNVKLWMRCFEDDKCEVYEDDSSEEDSSEESPYNSTTPAIRKFRVPHHLVPTVRTLIAKQDNDESDESDEDENKRAFAKLLNSSFIQNITNAIMDDDSDEDSSSEENELVFLLQGILNNLLNATKPPSLVRTTTPSPSTTTESLLSLFFNSQKPTNSILNTKNLALKNYVDVKQGLNNGASHRQSILNTINNQHASKGLHRANTNLISSMNGQLQHLANSETMKILKAFQTGNMGMPQVQSGGAQGTTLDPLTAMIAESIASQLNIPTPMLAVPTAAVPSMQNVGLMHAQQVLSGGGNLNININQGSGTTTTSAPVGVTPDLTFLASNINPNSKLAPKLQRLQLLLAQKKAKAAIPIPPTMQPSTSPIPQIPPMNNLMPTAPSNPTLNQQAQLLNMLTAPGQMGSSQSSNNNQMMQMIQAMSQSQATATTQSPSFSNLSRANAAKAKQAMELLQFLKIRKANRKLKKAKKSKKLIKFNKSIVNSLSKKDSKTRKAIKQLQALRMSQSSNPTVSFLKFVNVTRINDEDSSSESDERDKTKSKNGTIDDEDSDESDEEINMLLSKILIELGKAPNVTRPTTTSTTTTQNMPTTTTTAPSTTTTAPSTTTTRMTTSSGTTTPMNMAVKNILFQNHINVLHNKIVNQNTQRNQKTSQVTKQPVDLKSLSWNDVVKYFNAKRMG